MVKELEFLRLRDGLCSAVHGELAVYIAGMGFDRPSAEEQPGRDLRIGQAIREESQHVHFTAAKLFGQRLAGAWVWMFLRRIFSCPRQLSLVQHRLALKGLRDGLLTTHPFSVLPPLAKARPS